MRKSCLGFAARFLLFAILLLLHGSVSAREYRDPADFLTVWSGMLPIILAAPHGGMAALSGAHSILGQLATKGYKILPHTAGDEREHRYTGGYTTRTYGSHRGTNIDAIQLEVGGNLRSRKNLARTANDLAEAIANFVRAFLTSSEKTANP